jgi:bifunctional non-homologous end joining protein LigD
MVPTVANAPPAGPDWLHEVKFDGFRVQIHLEAEHITIYSRNGADFTRRFRKLKPAISRIPAESAIMDCELVACGSECKPDFRALMSGSDQLCLWCFDLLALNGKQLTDAPLHKRRARLQKLLGRVASRELQFSCEFDDPWTLLEAAERMGLEGIVSKRRSSKYSSGPTRDWMNVKTAAWRAANADRGEMFEK